MKAVEANQPHAHERNTASGALSTVDKVPQNIILSQVQMVFNETVLIVLIFVVWMTALTVYLYRMSSHYGRLTKGITSASLRDVLEQILNGNARTEKKLNELVLYAHRLDEAGFGHIQRIGIVRYNPFSDTGGSQSFSMALLDGRGYGIVITSLYGRSSNRWFVKDIEKGYGKDVELSKEEESAIRKARKEPS